MRDGQEADSNGLTCRYQRSVHTTGCAKTASKGGFGGISKYEFFATIGGQVKIHRGLLTRHGIQHEPASRTTRTALPNNPQPRSPCLLFNLRKGVSDVRNGWTASANRTSRGMILCGAQGHLLIHV